VWGSALDANGNTLSDAGGKSYTWDFENRLVQAVSEAVQCGEDAHSGLAIDTANVSLSGDGKDNFLHASIVTA
jgi:hypothetical protein